ncbi:recombinase family protein [Acinetobacter sp. ANC 3882]|uniref:helix-turn-helix domain-containing protein n=1 Tax=Acinetobacter sp. ANC 3882 TaxID=2923423 RepID=UPI001F4B2E49|nr:recombinase family protein [Acinetobacter sp. ANC 3882]MCH7315989.1 recombinase family protein [Acinetobacter sp. ANC 3882]
MRTYAYVRIDTCVEIESRKFLSFFNEYGYKIQKNRLVLEEVSVNKSIIFRDKLLNLINYSLEEDDLLVIKSIDCLGCSFEEILSLTDKIYQKKIRLICLDYSKSEISGDLKIFFLHFLKLCFEFEKQFSVNNEKQNKIVKKVGRPEILTNEQKNQVIEMFKRGESVYSLAKHFSVTRTVIQRILDKAAKK